MNKETIILVEGGSLVFDVNGLKNITGDKHTRLFSFIDEDMKSIDLYGQKLSVGINSTTTFVPPPCPRNAYCQVCGLFPLDLTRLSGIPDDFVENESAPCCIQGYWGGDERLCPGERGKFDLFWWHWTDAVFV